MFRNYLKIAIRNLGKHKTASFINISGLAIGITICLLIGLFIQHELSYDRHHKDAGRIYRVVKDFGNNDGSRLPDATSPPAIAPAMQKAIPEIEHVARLMPGWGNKFYVRAGERRFIEENIYRADSSIFDVFTFHFVQGNAKTALEQLDAIVLTESSAKKYFGNENPMGKLVEIDNRQPAKVTGVIKDLPASSHFHFDFLTPLRFRRNNGSIANFDSDWGRSTFYTYIKLKPGSSITSVDNKIRELYKRNQPESKNYFYSQALTDIHLNSNLKWELSPNSDRIYIYIFGTIALFVLIIACINYINLTTARSSLRAKEIGIRKVSGAIRMSLVRQFLTESMVTALLGAVLAIILAVLLLPAVNNITGKNLSLIPSDDYLPLLLVMTFTLLIGFIAGFYPALYLSSFEPAKVLKGERLSRVRGFSLRKVLVVTQFSISIALIIGSITVMQQIRFMQESKLGLDKDHVIMINDVIYLDRSQRELLKNELQQVPGVKKLAFASGIVGEQYGINGMRLKGSTNDQAINFMAIDQDYLDVLNMQLKEGRNFSARFPADTLSNGTAGTTERHAGGVILNETAVKQLGIPSPVIGNQLVYRELNDTTWYVEVIGVVKDFHFASMRNEIKPFGFFADNNRQAYFTVKLDGRNMSSGIEKIQAAWNKRVTTRPFQYFFLDETYAKLYAAEQNFKIIFFYITAIAIFISCLGLFGLSSFITQQRTKEIGIRKVLGASVSGIVGMLSKDFLKLVIIAAVLAFPVAWYAMNKWLQDFVYRIEMSWWVFAVAAMAALLIALGTISFQAIRSALANPVKSLRTE
jgi:putative ABC transport system permease protein